MHLVLDDCCVWFVFLLILYWLVFIVGGTSCMCCVYHFVLYCVFVYEVGSVVDGFGVVVVCS